MDSDRPSTLDGRSLEDRSFDRRRSRVIEKKRFSGPARKIGPATPYTPAMETTPNLLADARHGNLESVKAAAEAANSEQLGRALAVAALEGRTEVVEWLLDRGAD